MRLVLALLLFSAWHPEAAGQAFGPDTYRTSQQCTGSPTGECTGQATTPAGLSCAPTANGRKCTGFLKSVVDGTMLDVSLVIPSGTAIPLIVSLHGWGGSKDGQGYIADPLIADGYAVLRYSARGFGDSWGQVNLSDLSIELGDLRSMIGQVIDLEPALNADAVGIIGVSYGGGQTWLSLLQPKFDSPKKAHVRIRTVVPIVPWSDLLYSLAPNGRPEYSLSPAGSPKLSLITALFVSGQRKATLARPYPNYPDYLNAWYTWITAMEPNEVDPVYRQIIDGLAGYRSIWWQQQFWDHAAANAVPVFQVQGLTDDLFPLPEAKRMLLGLNAIAPGYPIASYFGDTGHPRASNKDGERDYMLRLIRDWFDWYLRGTGTVPAHVIRAAITRPRGQPFNPADVITVARYDQLATRTATKDFQGGAVLANPLSDPVSGACWDPLLMEVWPNLVCPPRGPVPAEGSLGVFTVPVAELTNRSSLLIAGQPAIQLRATTSGPRVQLNVRLIDVGPGGTRQLITRGSYILEGIAAADITIPTFGNLWEAPQDHLLQLEITNVDSPYFKPSMVPSVTRITRVRLEVPVRE
jgi:ABC-2 type transport system ATP-binding protein